MPAEAARALLVVAHPDDETIFFGALLHELRTCGQEVDIVCASGSFRTPLMTKVRRAEFQLACGLVGARPVLLDLSDQRPALDADRLDARLREVARSTRYDRVFTHGPWGEYGHRHHVDVARAVHRAFSNVRSLSGPLPHEDVRTLRRSELAAKRRLAATVYRSQPYAVEWCSSQECLTRLTKPEVELLASIATGADATSDDVPRPSGPCDARLTALLRHSAEGFAPTAPPFAEIANIPAAIWSAAHAERYRALSAILDDPAPDVTPRRRWSGDRLLEVLQTRRTHPAE